MKSEQEIQAKIEAWREVLQEANREENLEAAGKASTAIGQLEWVLNRGPLGDESGDEQTIIKINGHIVSKGPDFRESR